MDNKTLLSNLEDIKKISKKEYVLEKGFPLIYLENIPEDIVISKKLSILDIDSQKYDISTYSVGDVFRLIKDKVPSISISRYEEHDENYLNVSSLFLADFTTKKIDMLHILERPFKLNYIKTIFDETNSKWKLVNFSVYDQINTSIKYEIKDDLVYFDTSLPAKGFADYRCQSMNVFFLYEYIPSKIEQIYKYKGFE